MTPTTNGWPHVPTEPPMSSPELVAACRAWLAQQHSVLWSKAWNLDDGLDAPAEWLAEQVDAVLDIDDEYE